MTEASVDQRGDQTWQVHIQEQQQKVRSAFDQVNALKHNIGTHLEAQAVSSLFVIERAYQDKFYGKEILEGLGNEELYDIYCVVIDAILASLQKRQQDNPMSDLSQLEQVVLTHCLKNSEKLFDILSEGQ